MSIWVRPAPRSKGDRPIIAAAPKETGAPSIMSVSIKRHHRAGNPGGEAITNKATNPNGQGHGHLSHPHQGPTTPPSKHAWSYAIRERSGPGRCVVSLCQRAAVRASRRWRMRAMTPGLVDRLDDLAERAEELPSGSGRF